MPSHQIVLALNFGTACQSSVYAFFFSYIIRHHHSAVEVIAAASTVFFLYFQQLLSLSLDGFTPFIQLSKTLLVSIVDSFFSIFLFFRFNSIDKENEHIFFPLRVKVESFTFLDKMNDICCFVMVKNRFLSHNFEIIMVY